MDEKRKLEKYAAESTETSGTEWECQATPKLEMNDVTGGKLKSF